ncbi:hypothetical protein [Ferrimonas lipolytica]|uniref:Uncharacterized protein n=1 Tax=Ferrimonas lipolytica TaxID=2724191 RepID=A0A6H1UJY2_9GAMM|nr:hypothetical protein [Ferrimonas lipolytica]QIZ78112.1 hypothetical protein HER31_15110 [Ferrimonas lipolytica]
MMIKKAFVLSAVCASVLAVTGCSEDKEYVQDPALQQEVDLLTAEVEALEKANKTLAADNAVLEEQTSTFVSNFSEQCASIGINFDYVQPGDGDFRGASVAAFSTVSAEVACSDCHYADNDLGAPTNHGAGDNCESCHSNPHVEQEPIEGNPTDPTFPQPEFGSGVVDAETGASGPDYYTNGSYLNADYLVAQGDKSVTRYEWIEAGDDTETPLTSLAQACSTEDRQHVEEMFPNDGKAYELTSKSNSLAAKTVSTVSLYDADFQLIDAPQANVATFGYAIEKDASATELGEMYSTSMTINLNNTCHNAFMNGDARLEWYEYDPTQSVKTDLTQPARNRGARILVETDYAKSSMMRAEGWTLTPVFGAQVGETLSAEEFKAAYESNAGTVTWCDLHFKVKSIIPLG